MFRILLSHEVRQQAFKSNKKKKLKNNEFFKKTIFNKGCGVQFGRIFDYYTSNHITVAPAAISAE